MAQIAIGEAIGEGFRLIARRPLTILAWGFARVVFAAGVFALMAPIYFAMIGQFANFAASGAYNPQNLAAIQSLQGGSLLITLVGLFFGSVLYCAVFRSVMFPDQGAWAYLRVGAAELFFFLFFIGGFISMFIGMFIVLIPLLIIAGVAAFAHAPVISAIAIIGGYLAILVGLVWAICRVSMVGPMMVEDGKFHVFDAWALTKGHVWSLFMIALLVVVILIAIEVVLGVIALAIGAGWLAQAAGGAANLKTFFQRQPAEVMATLAPGLLVVAVFSVPVSGCLNAIMLAPWARAYRDLRPSSDVAATFA